MRVLLVQPPPNRNWGFFPFHSYFGFFVPSIGIQTIAASTYAAGHQVKVLEMHIESLNGQGFIKVLNDFRPDVVGASAVVCETYDAMSYFKIAKRVSPEIVTVLGGPHGSLSPEENLRVCPELDYVVRGEGEVTFVELLKHIQNHNGKGPPPTDIQGLGFLDQGRFTNTPDRPHVDLDSLPPIPYHLLKPGSKRYSIFQVGPLSHRAPAYSVEYSRGCAHCCPFCSKPIHWRSQMRFRSAERVVDDMERLLVDHGVHNFLISSTCLLADRARLEAFVTEMNRRRLRERGMNRFYSLARADEIVANRDYMPVLEKAGLGGLLFGLEAMDDETLNRIGKGTTANTNQQAHDIMKQANIPLTMMTALVGLPHHDIHAIRKLRNQLVTFDHGFIVTPPICPYPGSPLFYEYLKKNMIKHFDYSKYEVSGPICRTDTLEPEELERETGKIMAFQLLGPWYAFGQLRRMRPENLYQATMGPALVFNVLAVKSRQLLKRASETLNLPCDPLENAWQEARRDNIEYATNRANKWKANPASYSEYLVPSANNDYLIECSKTILTGVKPQDPVF